MDGETILAKSQGDANRLAAGRLQGERHAPEWDVADRLAGQTALPPASMTTLTRRPLRLNSPPHIQTPTRDADHGAPRLPSRQARRATPCCWFPRENGSPRTASSTQRPKTPRWPSEA